MDAGALQIPVDSPAKRTQVSYLHLYDTGIPTGICRYAQVTCRITCKFYFKLIPASAGSGTYYLYRHLCYVLMLTK
jgi:hypothetical protein